MTSSPTTTTTARATWPGSDLAFAQVREDPAIEALALSRLAAAPGREGRGAARVLLVCSGGETALALLERGDVASIDAVDPSPAELHLCELKRAAALGLSGEDLHRLLGVRRASRDERLALYARVREALPGAARAHWDGRQDQVAYGVQQVGRFEALFRELAASFRAEGLDPLARPAEALACPRWRELFESVFERERLAATFGRAAVAYSMDRSDGEHFADVFARALRRWRPSDENENENEYEYEYEREPAWEGENYFLRQVWEDRYAVELERDDPAALPEWLREPERLASRRPERLRLHEGRFLETFARLVTEGPFDLVQTSNISDWAPVPELEALVDRVAGGLTPGGAILMRRLNGDHDLAAIVARRLIVDRAECEELRRRDRSFFYREVVLGRRPLAEVRPSRPTARRP